VRLRKIKPAMENVYIALDKSTDAATVITDDSNEVDMHKDREMILEPGAQLGMVNICWETEKE
jgi:hypothetical protein